MQRTGKEKAQLAESQRVVKRSYWRQQHPTLSHVHSLPSVAQWGRPSPPPFREHLIAGLLGNTGEGGAPSPPKEALLNHSESKEVPLSEAGLHLLQENELPFLQVFPSISDTAPQISA